MNGLHSRPIIKRLAWSGVSLLSLVAASAASAQDTAADAAPADDEIIVTARNREERLQDTPLSITALNATQIQRQRVQSFEDVARLDPSLNFDRGSGLQDTRPVIRGLPSSRGRPPVGILVDGVDASSESMGASAGGSTLLNARALEIERIEVVKGPQSALYGRVAFGGAINYVTKKPSMTFGGEIGGEVGEYGAYEGRAAVTGPIADGIAVRANGYYSRYGGSNRNTVSGKRIGGFDSYGGGASILLDRGRGNALLKLNYSKDHIEPAAQEYQGLLSGANTNVPLSPAIVGKFVGVGAPGPLPAFISTLPLGTVRRSPAGVRLSLDPRTGDDYDGARVKTFRAALTVNVELSDAVKLTSISAYTHAKFREREDIDFFGVRPTTVAGPGGPGLGEVIATPPGLPAATGPTASSRFAELNIFDGNAKQFNQELRLGSLEGGPLRWAIGALYWYESYSQRNYSANYAVPPGTAPAFTGFSGYRNVTLVQNSIGNLSFAGRPYDKAKRVTEHTSGYALLEYDITPQLTVSAEARYSHEAYDYPVFDPVIGTAPVPQANGGYPLAIIAQGIPRQSSTNFFTPKGVIRYTPTPDLMLYASAGKGVKPAGYSTVVVTDSSLASFGTEKLYNYEVGLKSSFLDRKVTVNLAGFYMRYRGKQVSVATLNPLTATGFANRILNAGGARVYGVEANLTVQPVEGLTLNAGYTYLDAKYTSYQNPLLAAILAVQADSCTTQVIGTATFCTAELGGNRLERTPKHAITGFGRYAFPINDDLRVFAEGDVRYTSNRPLDEFEKRFFPAVTTANVRLGVETDRYSLLVYGDNVFNNKRIIGGGAGGDGLAPGNLVLFLSLPERQRFGVRGSYKF